MLTRKAAAAALLAAALLLAPAAAHAGGFTDDVGGGTIGVHEEYTKDSDGWDARGGGPAACTWKLFGGGEETTIPCTDSSGGWWSRTFNCYMRPARLPAGVAPRPGMELWSCEQVLGPGRTVVTLMWLPEGQGPGPDPAVVIRDRAEAVLKPPAIGITPPRGSAQPGLVGLGTWLWVEGGWSPVTITATAGPMSITATATVTSAGWNLGDGTTVTCGPGTPYSAGYGSAPSPTCGHTYRRAGDYTVTATLHWRVAWSTSDGRSGAITLDTASSTGHRIAEAYGLVVGQG